MFDFTSNRKPLAASKSLYCIWIRAHEGDNTPLIRVWIDLSMQMFESRADAHKPDSAAARPESQAVARESRS
jgi:hypothetical protein